MPCQFIKRYLRTHQGFYHIYDDGQCVAEHGQNGAGPEYGRARVSKDQRAFVGHGQSEARSWSWAAVVGQDQGVWQL